MSYVNISIEFDIDLDEHEVWPDGAPIGWDAQSVVDEGVSVSSSILGFIQDWALDCGGGTVNVYANVDGEGTLAVYNFAS